MFAFRALSCTGAILKNLFQRCLPAETMTFRDMGYHTQGAEVTRQLRVYDK